MEKTRVIVSNIYLLDENTKEETRLLGEMTFGRSEGEKTYPQDTAISRKHFRMIPADDVVLIEDLGSTNKTKVNGKQLKPNTLYKLNSRDRIEFGKQKLQVFIGGQIVADEKKAVKSKEAPESSMIFERFSVRAGEMTLEDASSGPSLEVSRMISTAKVLESKGSTASLGKVQELAAKKGSAWYVRFESSEFGPMTWKELKVVVKSDQFKGGTLMAYADGLDDWIPVKAMEKIFDMPLTEYTATERLDKGAPLKATVVCYLTADRRKKVSCECAAISLADISLVTNEPMQPELPLFEIEVQPESGAGIEKFRARVRIDSSKFRRGGLGLILVDTPPRTKMQIEKYIKTKS